MMNCDDIRDLILSGRTPAGPEVEGHLADCEGCRELLRGDGLAGLLLKVAPVPPPRIGGLLDRLRSISTPGRVVALSIGAFLIGALNALFMLRTDADVYPLARMVVVLAAFAAAALAAGILVLRPLHLPRPDRRLLPGLVIVGILLPLIFGALPVAHAFSTAHPESFEGTGADFWPRAIACLIFGAVLGIPIFGLLWLLGRGGKTRLATVLGGLTAAALIGNVALQLHCPLVSPAHLLVGHAGVPIALLLIGLPFALRRRRQFSS